MHRLCRCSGNGRFPPSGQLSSDPEGDGNPKLWCALNDGKVVVFDAASWSMEQNCIQVGVSQLVRSDHFHSVTVGPVQKLFFSEHT